MSRRFLFLLAAFVVILYFSIILYMLNPLTSARGRPSFNVPYQLPAVEWCHPLRKQSPPGKPVALVSYPGSGNTWLRYLLQQVTGILTGSIYLDHGLRLHGFPAENVADGSVLVVKTHSEPPKKAGTFESAILLVRVPQDAILADFNRIHMGHIGTAPRSAFKKKNALSKIKGKEKALDWSDFVYDQGLAWENLHKLWLQKFPGPLHIVFYEDLVRDTRRSLTEILHFLNFNFTESDMSCALEHKEGIYRRRRQLQDFDPFTEDMYRNLTAAKKRVFALVKRYKRKRNRIHKFGLKRP